MSNAPVQDVGETQPTDGIGLALSGGGYRAMLFHAGAIIRLFETGMLQQVMRISSVSGGSIAAAKLALEWPHLADRAALMTRVIEPLRAMAGISIDVTSVLSGALLSGNAGSHIASAYAHHLFGDATLQEIPDAPVFVINATNVETGSLWRFSKAYARDWQVGEIVRPRFRLADAVAASSAFPPVLSPFILETRPSDFTTVEPGVDHAFLTDIALTDGGVYDNLGLETIYKRCKTLLVSNGSGSLPSDPSPPSDWLRHTRRVIDLIHGQVSSVRIRDLIASYQDNSRAGAYWGIATDIADYGLPDALPVPAARSVALAQTPTRLTRMDDRLVKRLINLGYAISDAALRARLPANIEPSAPAFPYSDVAV